MSGVAVPNEMQVRNATISARRRAGESLSHIAADYGIKRERVRQIVMKQDQLDRLELRRRSPLELWDLPTRAYMALRRGAFSRADQIQTSSDEELLAIKGIGRKQLNDIRRLFPQSTRSVIRHKLARIAQRHGFERLERIS